jgi:hypothetical protein
MHKLFATRRRKVIAAMVAMLAIPGVALAAWVLYSGASGTITGKTAQTTTATAITITAASPPVLENSGTPVPLNLTLKNNDASAARSITSVAAPVVTMVPAACAAHLTVNGLSPAVVGQSVPAGATVAAQNSASITFAAAAPSTCANADYSIAITGVTN